MYEGAHAIVGMFMEVRGQFVRISYLYLNSRDRSMLQCRGIPGLGSGSGWGRGQGEEV